MSIKYLILLIQAYVSKGNVFLWWAPSMQRPLVFIAALTPWVHVDLRLPVVHFPGSLHHIFDLKQKPHLLELITSITPWIYDELVANVCSRTKATFIRTYEKFNTIIFLFIEKKNICEKWKLFNPICMLKLFYPSICKLTLEYT